MHFVKSNPKICIGALVGVGVYLLPRLVFGQEAAPIEEAAAPWWSSVLITLLATFSTAIAGLLAIGVRKGVAWLAAHVESQYLSGVIQRTGPILEELVDDNFKAFVQPLKKSGKWDAATKKEAKEAVKARLRILVGADGVKKLAKVLGAPETADAWIGGLVEAAVSSRKMAGRQPKALKAAAANPTAG